MKKQMRFFVLVCAIFIGLLCACDGGFRTQGERTAKIHSHCIGIAEADHNTQTYCNAQAHLCAAPQTDPDTYPHKKTVYWRIFVPQPSQR